MDVLENFAGAGGGLLAHYGLLGHTPVAASEIGVYQRQVLAYRQQHGQLPRMTVYDDIHKVRGTKYRGIGCVGGGFPCQNISASGDGSGIDGLKSRLIWEMLRVVNEARPRYVFAENSDRLRTKGLNRICRALQAIGYGRIAWGTISAADVGAPHLRKRMWLMAKRISKPAIARLPVEMPADGVLCGTQLTTHAPWVRRRTKAEMPTLTVADSRNSGNRPNKSLWTLSDVLGTTAKHKRHGRQILSPTLVASDWRGHSGAGTQRLMALRSRPLRDVLPFIEGGNCINPIWAEWYMGWCPDWTDLTEPKPNVDVWRSWTNAARWWTDDVETSVLPRTLPKRPADLIGRITALGNGQVPLCAATAFTLLQQEID